MKKKLKVISKSVDQAVTKVDKNVGKALTGNSHAGVGALVKTDASSHKEAVKGFREVVGLSNNTNTINEAAPTPTPASVETPQPVVPFTQQIPTPVINNVPQTNNTSQAPNTTTANANEAINENEQASIAMATNASLEEKNADAGTVTTSKTTNEDAELAKAIAASLKPTNTQSFTTSAQSSDSSTTPIQNEKAQNNVTTNPEKSAAIEKIVKSLIEHGNVGRSQQKDVEALERKDIAILDKVMMESLKDEKYNEGIKDSLLAFYNIILKLTPEKELPKHIMEVLNKYEYGVDADVVFKNLLEEDNAYALKLEQETERKLQENFSNSATESKVQGVPQSKLNEEDFTKVEPKSEISSLNIASQETNSSSELQKMLEDALNAGNQSLVDEILDIMGNGNHS